MAQRLVERLHARQQELDRERQITALPPVLKGAALVIPAGLLAARAPADSARRVSRLRRGCGDARRNRDARDGVR